MNEIILSLIVLLSTIIVEFLVYWGFIRKNPVRLFFYSILINSLTLPLGNYTYQYLLHNFLLIEAIIVVAESVLLWLLLKQKYHNALLLSLIANILTALMSFLFYF